MEANREELTRRIKSLAREHGFTHVGMARAEKLDKEADHLRSWLRNDFMAGMKWMEAGVERRTDPEELVPRAASVIAVAINYYTTHEHNQNSAHGKISRYAWGDDYHDLVLRKLRALEADIRSLAPESASRAWVDTGPVMEKAWAARSGIGWLGKNGNIITRDMGSWVFLGVIVTTLELEYDNPALDYCGTCTACLDACPTDAFAQPYVVDANRCISYLTIETKEESIPGAEKMDFRNWIFGCDICQDVCPWNSFARDTDVSGFSPREFSREPLLADIERLEDEEFRSLFRKSPVKRTKLRGLKRNARIVLAQAKQSRAGESF